jgi:two-component system OmpR family sensor kinase
VARRLLPGGLRAQLALAIALVTMFGVAASFLALYSGTSARLRAQLDAQLQTQAAEWRQFIAGVSLSTPATLERTAVDFIAAQRYHAESLIIVVQVNGDRTVSNNRELLAQEQSRERGGHEPTGLLDSPIGLATASVAEAGTMRVLVQPIDYGHRRVGTLRVADPMTPVSQAQSSLLRSFALVGTLALVLAIAAGIALATLIAAPLRRIARVAVAVDAGDLSRRAGPLGGRGEVSVLSEAFDHMLERLERTFKRQRDFVSDASHELRTPLAVLRAQVELLDRETDEQGRHEATTTLLRRLDELDRLVADMLTLASAEAGQLVELHPIDLGEFFEDLRRDLPLFGERRFVLQPVEGTLQADRDRLTQVFRNLIRNAVAHTDPDARITVAARAREDHLQISVTDSGAGIPPDQLERIFERFRRLDAGRSRDRGGSGLGLAIARAITEAHGGSIRAESGPGQGATFRIDLPGYRPQPAGIAAAGPVSSRPSR